MRACPSVPLAGRPGRAPAPDSAQNLIRSGRAAPSGGGGGGARVVHGNNALQMLADAVPETQQQVRMQEEDVVVPMSLRVTIVELKESMCRWPLGDPTSSEFRYCGSPAPGTGPYCTHHGKMAYQPMQDRRRDRDRRVMLAR